MLGGRGWLGRYQQEEGEGAATGILGTNRPSAPLVSTKRRGASLAPHHRYQHDGGVEVSKSTTGTNTPFVAQVST